MSEPTRPGWHPDPSGTAGLERWWNGMSWGEQTRSAPGGPPGPAYRPPPGPPPLPPRRPGRVALVFFGSLFGIVVVFIGVIVTLAVVLPAGPREASTDFFTDVRRGNLDSAAARLCTRYADHGVDRISTAYPEPVLGFDVVSVERTDDTAVVTGRLTVGTASAYELELTLVREQNDWKICSFPGGAT